MVTYARRVLMLAALCWIAPVSAQAPVAAAPDCEEPAFAEGQQSRDDLAAARMRPAADSIGYAAPQLLP